MSAIATVFAQREIPAGSPVAHADTAGRARRRPVADVLRRRRPLGGSLAALPVGAHAIVTGVGGDFDPAAARRLVDLGFAPGAHVEVLRRAPMGDPTVFRVADTEIALRRRHAESILVQADELTHR
ncbi:FeoA family protein [Mobilicoccus pelagius]|uniref:Putative transcriptional regulator n=1 Tax=Mobilicoccus pelagius NBRC 104925 TaxID=1089455 RepID=H5UVW9_9MICO|nr:FeoA family protein [Mobilicoccus pelagius]GAB49877.1 putative transcriptional regulator [Mobilicoccus pelagius NBRC 104925]